ncbi:unnamed protein product [Dibothriocephalus latus]|uniref:RNase NYN domain-containing protein n=1 Tax=Dibothriocephalus latus TaxID=60516 RepID=A0A3P7LSK0_DIBLA|nr:unnamed protein product [Dibothriocephalus latus]
MTETEQELFPYEQVYLRRHGVVPRPSFNAQNLRCALDYFLERGHEDILIVLHGIRQASCSMIFTEAELAKYFSFASCRRLCKETLIADDDRLAVSSFFITFWSAFILTADYSVIAAVPKFFASFKISIISFKLNCRSFLGSGLGYNSRRLFSYGNREKGFF